jgi:hypothetical protein
MKLLPVVCGRNLNLKWAAMDPVTDKAKGVTEVGGERLREAAEEAGTMAHDMGRGAQARPG